MLAVKTESQANEVGLFGPAAKAVVGEIAKVVGFQIENRERLFSVGGVGTVAAVEKNCEAAIRRNCRGSGEIIYTAGIAGEFTEDFGIGDFCCFRVRRGVLS